MGRANGEKKSPKIRKHYHLFKSFGWQRMYIDLQDGKYMSWKVLSKYSFLTDISIPLRSDGNTMNPARDTWIPKGYQQKLQSYVKTAMTDVQQNSPNINFIKRHSKNMSRSIFGQK